MTEPSPTGTTLEVPVFFPGGDEEIFGIVTRPDGVPNDVGVVLMTARGTFHRNRLSVRTARRIAAHGFRVIRFDYQGMGESSGQASFELSTPLEQNVAGAIDVLSAEGSRRFVLVGSCFGARSALAAADSITGLEGLVLAVMPFGNPRSLPDPRRRHRLRRSWELLRRALADPASLKVLGHVVRAGFKRRWHRFRADPEAGAPRIAPQSRKVEGWLDRLVARRVPVLLLFGAEDEAYRGFLEATKDWSDSLREEMDRLLEVRVASRHDIHGHASIEAQDWLLDVVEGWMLDRGFDSAPGDRPDDDSPAEEASPRSRVHQASIS